MTVPGLALFYGGLVRSKNMLSVLMQVFATVCFVTIIWFVTGTHGLHQRRRLQRLRGRPRRCS